MSTISTIDVGTPDVGGDSLYTAGGKINTNFSNLNADKQEISAKDQANGYPGLNGSTLLNINQFPTVTPAKGGTGVVNGANNTITFTGDFTLGITLSGNTSVTFPTSGTLLTSASTLNAANLSGTIPSAVLGNSTVYIGTTAVALNRSSASLALTGITSIDGAAATAAISNDTTTSATMYPTWVTTTSGNQSIKTSSTKLTFNPSSGTLTATAFSGSGASLTNLPAASLSGTIPSGVLGNSTVYIGTTAVALNRGSGALVLTGITSIDGSAASATNATNATNIGITNDTTTNATMYPTWVTATTGNLPAKTSSTKLTFNPSSGTLAATVFSGSGASLTNLAAANLSGTIPSGVLGNSTVYIGTTAVALNRGSGALVLTGITSIDGSAASATSATNATNTAITDDTTTSATMYPTWVTTTSGNQAQKVSSTKLTFNPSSGTLTATAFSGGGSALTSLTAGNLSGTIPSGVLGNSTLYVGTTAVALNRSSATLSVTGIKLGDLTSNGLVQTSGSDGTLSINTNGMFDNVVETYTKAQYFTGTSYTYSGGSTHTWDLDSNQVYILTAGSTMTVAVSNQHSGATYVLILKQDATGSRSISWSSSFRWPGGTAPTLGTGSNAINVLSFVSDGTYMYGVGQSTYS